MNKEKKSIALQKKLIFMRHTRLIKECAKIDPKVEKEMAEEGVAEDVKNWPEY